MTGKPHRARNMHALLIGIDRYLPNELPGGFYYRDLSACVRDVDQVERFLRENAGLKQRQITKLTASVAGSGGENRIEEPPTYANIVNAFKELIRAADPGDQIYIHYSGHGGRATTLFESLKKKDGLDEVVVPCDIGETQGRYFRDIEFAYLIQEMLQKDLIVTIVMDSCHSGSVTRDPAKHAAHRGMGAPDKTVRPMSSLVASDQALLENWTTLATERRRNLSSGSNWLLEPKGYVLLAACGAHELAYEFAFDGNPPQGALTYFWLQSLRQLGSGATYKMAHDWLFGRVRSHFVKQTPQLEGEGNRIIFDDEQIRPYYAVNVLQVDETANRILLQTGQAQGLRERAHLVIYRGGTSSPTDITNRLALAEISELGATESWANIIERLTPSPIAAGAQAVLMDHGDIKLRGRVCILPTSDVPSGLDQQTALNAVERAIEQEGGGFLDLVQSNEPTDFYVTLNADGRYEILDYAESPMRLYPRREAGDELTPAMIVRRLVHLTKYRNVRLLDNHDQSSKLPRKVRVELAGYMPEYETTDKPEPVTFAPYCDSPEVKTGQWVFLRVRNEFSSTLNLTVLDLQPDYGISQVYPESPAQFESLDPDDEILLPLQASLPESFEVGEDVLKVFVTLGSTDFRCLELPPLDQQPLRALNRGDSDPLEAVIDSLNQPELRKRTFKSVAQASRQWWTKSISLKTVAAGS